MKDVQVKTRPFNFPKKIHQQFREKKNSSSEPPVFQTLVPQWESYFERPRFFLPNQFTRKLDIA